MPTISIEPSLQIVRGESKNKPSISVNEREKLFDSRSYQYSPHLLYSPNILYPYGKSSGVTPDIIIVKE